MIKKYIFVLIALVLFQPYVLNAQQKTPLSLEDAVAIALNQNFDILIGNKNLESAQVNNSWEAAGMFPSVVLGASQTNRLDNAKVVTTGDRDDLLRLGIQPYVQVQWVLFNGFSVYINKDKLSLIEQLSEGNSVVIIENKLQAVVLAYYKTLLNTEKLATIEKVKKLSFDRYEYLQSKKEFGTAVTYDVLQAKTAYLSDSANYLLQSLELKTSELNLNLLMGVDKSMNYELTSDFTASTEFYPFADLEAKMLSDNKTLHNQYINMEILQKDVELAKAIVWPTLSLSSGTDYISSRSQYLGSDAASSYSYDFYVNFSLNFNLYNGGKTRRALAQAMIKDEIGQIQESQMKQVLSNGLFTIYEMYNIRKQLLDITNARLEAAQLNLDLSSEKFKNGSINSFNFRDVQIQYINAEFSRLESVYNLIDTHTELLRITGGIISEYN